MPWIQNIPLRDVISGEHLYEGKDKTVLIQIVNTDFPYPTPAKEFKEIHQFRFLDIDKRDIENPVFLEKFKADLGGVFTDEQAYEIVSILEHCRQENLNVVVHCHAGVCRSGAVASVASIHGFEDAGENKTPNLLVKDKLMKQYGRLSFRNMLTTKND